MEYAIERLVSRKGQMVWVYVGTFDTLVEAEEAKLTCERLDHGKVQYRINAEPIFYNFS